MRAVVVGMILGWVFLATGCTPARADGGSLRLSGKQGGYQIAVFTAPTPLRAGAVDISALVQNASTGDPLPQVKVTVRMTRPGRHALEYPATSAAATNKLFRSAQFELPEPGRWEMQVQVEGPSGLEVLAGVVEAAEPLPRWREIWPWVGWPALAITLFSIHEMLVQRKGRSRTGRSEPDRHESRHRGLEEIAPAGNHPVSLAPRFDPHLRRVPS
jgi:hypothetical protein